MNLKKISEILSLPIEQKIKENLILEHIAEDKNAIPTMLKILNFERNAKRELIVDMNLELSRAHVYIDERPEPPKEGKASFNKGFVVDEIAKFYIKYKGRVTHCFNRFN